MSKKKKVTTKNRVKKTAAKTPVVEAALLVAEKKLKKKKIIKNIPIKSKPAPKVKLAVKQLKKTNIRHLLNKKGEPKKLKIVTARKKIPEAPQNLPLLQLSETKEGVGRTKGKIKIIKSASPSFRSPHLIDLRIASNPVSGDNNSYYKFSKNKITKQKKPALAQIKSGKNKLFFKKNGSIKTTLTGSHKQKNKSFALSSRVLKNSGKQAGELFIVNIIQLLAIIARGSGRKIIKINKIISHTFIKTIKAGLLSINKLAVGNKTTDPFKKISATAGLTLNLFYLSLNSFYKFITSTKNYFFSIKPALPLGWHKKLASFFVISLLVVMPLRGLLYYEQLQNRKGEVLGISAKAFKHLKAGGELSLKDPLAANKEFNTSLKNFNYAEEQLKNIDYLILKTAKLLPGEGDKVQTGEVLLKAGKNIAQAGELLSREFAPLAKNNSLHLTKKISIIKQNLEISLPLLEEAEQYLKQAKTDHLPQKYRDDFTLVGKKLPLLITQIKNFVKFSDTLLNVLGHNETKRYLIFFQNNAELRPTGGFLGSFALLDIDRGEIKNLEIPGGGTYDMNGGLKEKILAPYPLHLVNARWQLQDANWFADFPASARKIMWFYEHSGGPSVDGVITVTPDVVEKILAITGPIDLNKKYGVTINKDNFWKVVQKEAEKKFYETKESKKIISEMAPLLIEKINKAPRKQFLQILSILNKTLEEKYILFYFRDPQLEKTIMSFGWSGEIKQVDKDYLAVIDTNISGGKTDRLINTLITHKAEIKKDGSVIDTVIIKKTHTGKRNDALLTGVKNMDYLRVYVPRGSSLLEAKGFLKPPLNLFKKPAPDLTADLNLAAIEGKAKIDKRTGIVINQEFGKTVFADWLEIEPSSTTIVTLKYKLPFTINKKSDKTLFDKLTAKKIKNIYTLFVQKQPGTTNKFISQIKLPKNKQLVWKYPSNLTAGGREGLWTMESKLDTDKFIGLVLEKNN